MLKELFFIFFKDRFVLILIYLLNLSCILLFFYLSVPAYTEFFYPLSIGLFLLVLFLLLEWIRFYPTNLAIARQLKNQGAELQPQTEQQKAFVQFLNKLTGEHTSQYNELKEQNKERLYFLSHWMHHLKTPVSVIELIINKEERTEALEKIQQENKRTHAAIEQGLTMIRMDSFANDFDVKSVDLIFSLRKLINSRKKEMIYQSVFPLIDSECEEAFIVTDPKWNEMMIEQIISNAIKYSGFKDGSKKLAFRIQQDEKHVYLDIIDEGVGIPSYDLERVFQPFFTGENGRKYPDSTGIGLYLSKKIADNLEAEITIQSVMNEGTAVTIKWLRGADS